MEHKWSHKSVIALISKYQNEVSGDPSEIIRVLARRLVLESLTSGWNGPPFDLFKLCQTLNINVLPSDLVIDARISIDSKGKYLIEYNPYQNQSRINFSLAHEIGHSLFDDCGETIRYRKKSLETDSWELEFLCNIAAAEILLPYSVFYKDANNVQLSVDNLISLADKYKASLESVFIRLCEVSDKPCLALLTSFNGKDQLEVQYALSSKSCKLRKPKSRSIIPLASKAYDCIKAGWTSHQIESWPIYGEEKFRVFSVGLPPIRKHTSPRVGILIVPDQWDAIPISNIYTVKGDATEPRGEGNKIIVQIVNTNAGLGMGFGKAMSTKYPESKEAVDNWKKNKKSFRLGDSQLLKLADDIWVCQILAQDGLHPKNGQIPLKYESLYKGISMLLEHAKALDATVHMPMIGTGQAMGDWDIIQSIISQELIQNNIDVSVYVLPKRPMEAPKEIPNLFNQLSNE